MIISINKAYFSHLPAYISATEYQRTYVGWYSEKYALFIEIIILSLFLNIVVHFLEMFLLLVLYSIDVDSTIVPAHYKAPAAHQSTHHSAVGR